MLTMQHQMLAKPSGNPSVTIHYQMDTITLPMKQKYGLMLQKTGHVISGDGHYTGEHGTRPMDGAVKKQIQQIFL